MHDLVELTMDKEVRNNPQQIAQMIIELADDIDSCQNDLSEIKDRKFFKRFFSNNTKDLADAMIKQNDTIGLFLNIVQALIMFNMNNTVILAEIQRELTLHEKSKGNFQNKYVLMAQEYIEESYQTALVLKNQLEAQSKSISDLEKRVEELNNERKSKKAMFTGENIGGVYYDRSMIWRIASSWWLLFSFSIGVLNWVMFLFIGFKVRHKKWILFGFLYFLPFLLTIVFPNTEAIYGLVAAAGVVSTIHGFSVRKEYLMRRIMLEQMVSNNSLEQRLQQEYNLAETASTVKTEKN